MTRHQNGARSFFTMSGLGIIALNRKNHFAPEHSRLDLVVHYSRAFVELQDRKE